MAVPSPSTGEEKVLAGVAYMGAFLCLVPTIVILIVKKDSPFVRYHCFQMLSFLLVSLLCIVINIALAIVGTIPFFGAIIGMGGSLLMVVIGLGIMIYWIIIMIKAFQGETMKIPVIGDYIEANLLN